MKSRKLFLIVSLVLAFTMSLSGTVAYLTDTDEAVNVMTLGNVKIEQLENGEAKDGFQQGQPLYPAYIETTNGQTKVNGLVAKEVTVENKGTSDAFVRTIIAFEAGNETDLTTYQTLINAEFASTKEWLPQTVAVGGRNYFVAYVTYPDALAKGNTTKASLLSVYMSPQAGNDDVAQFGETYEILVLSQACQTVNFENLSAEEALNVAFGSVEEKAAEWLANVDVEEATKPYTDNQKVEFNGIVYENIYAAVAAAKAVGGGTIKLLGNAQLDKPVEIDSDIEIDGGGCTLTRAEGYTGNMFTVKPGCKLEMNAVVVDGGAVWADTANGGRTNSGVKATGNLIAAKENAIIILKEGTVLKNNDGACAVDLGTRIGATLEINGAEIVNNSSNAGAIWGGGHITMNSGKISNNSSTGIAGAIRMVSSCNLTMNGGEISNNTAAGDGGAIWGYGSSTYHFKGGKMNNNTSAGTGGAIYTGTYSVIYISGDFELCNNKAANSGAIRLTDHTSMTMTGGKVSGNTQNGESNAFNTWNNSISITGGQLEDNMSYVGGLGLTIGNADINGTIHYNLSTNHNTAYLEADFEGFNFKVNEADENFSNFNFKPAAGYTYTEGDETKLACMNEGYETYWNAATGTFKLQAK